MFVNYKIKSSYGSCVHVYFIFLLGGWWRWYSWMALKCSWRFETFPPTTYCNSTPWDRKQLAIFIWMGGIPASFCVDFLHSQIFTSRNIGYLLQGKKNPGTDVESVKKFLCLVYNAKPMNIDRYRSLVIDFLDESQKGMTKVLAELPESSYHHMFK
jgi:hypothetical protein